MTAERLPPLDPASLAADVEALRRHVAASRLAQEAVQAFRERYERLPPDTPLPPDALRRLRDGKRPWLALQRALLDTTRRYAPLARVRPGGPAADPAGRTRGVLIGLGAALTLYDNHLVMRSLLDDPRLRRLVRDPARGYGMEEREVVEAVEGLNDHRNRARLHRLVRWYDQVARDHDPRDDDGRDLRDIVASSVSYRYARASRLDGALPTTERLGRERIVDALDRLAEVGLGAISKAFGNGIGLVETRKGKLFGDVALARELAADLRPLDVLLEKTPFRLTDRFIPGHWGHVAVWLGTDAELSALGLWDAPPFQTERYRAYRRMVGEGASVLEALRSGVRLSTLEDFLNVDDLAVLRPAPLDREDAIAALLRGFEQVGKEYDFNFEVETLDRITCSELPYHVYPEVDWDTDVQLGSITISPDQVAAQALGEDPDFRLEALFHDGHRVPADRRDDAYRRLLQG